MSGREHRRRGWYWPYLIIAFLMLDVGIYLGGAYVASRDPSFTPEDKFYEKSLHWDEHARQIRSDEALGWRVTLNVTLPAAGNGDADVMTVLTDRDGAPVAGARMELSGAHLARSADVLKAAAKEIGPGLYRASLPIKRLGLWEFHYEIKKGDTLFAPVIRQDVALPAWGR